MDHAINSGETRLLLVGWAGQRQIGIAFLKSEVGWIAVLVGHHRSLVRLLARSMRGSRRRMLSMVGELQFNRKAKLERICGNASPRFPRRTFEHESRRIPLSFNAGLQAAGTETHYLQLPQSCKWHCFGILCM